MFENFAAKLKRMREAKGEEENVTFKPFPEETEIKVKAEEKVEEPKKIPQPEAKADAADANIELKVVRPATFDEVSTVADYLLAGCTVVLNLELLDMPQVVRMLDFLNGVTYSTDGDIKNVAKSTYIITPHNIDVSDNQ